VFNVRTNSDGTESFLRARLLASATAAMVVAMSLIAPTVALAAPKVGPGSFASSLAGCPGEPRSTCLYNTANYGGRTFIFAPPQSSRCIHGASMPGGVRSYRSGLVEGYLYSGTDCTGRTHAVQHDISRPDIGFQARSFEVACVRCRSGDE
jgi:hypothetical protein